MLLVVRHTSMLITPSFLNIDDMANSRYKMVIALFVKDSV